MDIYLATLTTRLERQSNLSPAWQGDENAYYGALGFSWPTAGWQLLLTLTRGAMARIADAPAGHRRASNA